MRVRQDALDTLVAEVDFLTIADCLKVLSNTLRYVIRLNRYRSPLARTLTKDIRMLIEVRLLEKFWEKHARPDPRRQGGFVFADEKNAMGAVVARPQETWGRIHQHIVWDVRGARLIGTHASVREKLEEFNALALAESIQEVMPEPGHAGVRARL